VAHHETSLFLSVDGFYWFGWTFGGRWLDDYYCNMTKYESCDAPRLRTISYPHYIWEHCNISLTHSSPTCAFFGDDFPDSLNHPSEKKTLQTSRKWPRDIQRSYLPKSSSNAPNAAHDLRTLKLLRNRVEAPSKVLSFSGIYLANIELYADYPLVI
jgi:hypothetical protein